MSVIIRPPKDDCIKKDIAQLKERDKQTTQILETLFKASVVSDRAAGINYISDESILQSSELIEYPIWIAGAAYVKGDILSDGQGKLFEVVAPHTASDDYPLHTTFAYYRIIQIEHTGQKDDPIPYPEETGILVNVKSGLYYIYNGKVYQAKTDMPNCVYPPDTPNMWQWEEIQ